MSCLPAHGDRKDETRFYKQTDVATAEHPEIIGNSPQKVPRTRGEIIRSEIRCKRGAQGKEEDASEAGPGPSAGNLEKAESHFMLRPVDLKNLCIGKVRPASGSHTGPLSVSKKA